MIRMFLFKLASYIEAVLFTLRNFNKKYGIIYLKERESECK